MLLLIQGFFHSFKTMSARPGEVDRYIAWPGQALAYKLGQMKIVELRERARESLGDKFDIRAFHDAVLADGPLPLEVLETRINEWIGSRKAVRAFAK